MRSLIEVGGWESRWLRIPPDLYHAIRPRLRLAMEKLRASSIDGRSADYARLDTTAVSSRTPDSVPPKQAIALLHSKCLLAACVNSSRFS